MLSQTNKGYYQKNKLLIKQFLKFGIVGAVGTFIDFALLNLFHQFFGWWLYLSATLSFLAAVINNYLFNKYWTFKNFSGNKGADRQFAQFVLVSIVGLLINLGVMSLLVEKWGIWYNWAKAVATLVVLFWNFWANRFWTFRPTKSPDNNLPRADG